jgi:class III poly(R)-hydroxyalkanoic acid synthase PhaE subunit
MADDTSRADPWSAAVAQMQQELLHRWLKLSAAPAEVSALFEWWPKLAATAAPSLQQFGPAWELYFSLGRTMLQEFGSGEAKAADPASRARSFAAAMQTWFEQFGAQLGQLPNFRLPPDAQQWWQTLMHAGSMPPGAAPKSADFAALGVTRERQEAWQKFARLLAQYQEVQTKLARQWVKIGAEATKRFAARISATGAGAPGDSMESLKGLYDLWIECAEEVYGSIAHSPEYGQLIAELANSSNAVRAEQQRELESWARQFDLPTRAEINSLHQQVKELRARMRAQAPSPLPPTSKPKSKSKSKSKSKPKPKSKSKKKRVVSRPSRIRK